MQSHSKIWRDRGALDAILDTAAIYVSSYSYVSVLILLYLEIGTIVNMALEALVAIEASCSSSLSRRNFKKMPRGHA